MIIQDQSATFVRRFEALLDQNLPKVVVEGDGVEFNLTLDALLGSLVVVQRHVEELGKTLLHLAENAFDRRVGLEAVIDCIAFGNEYVVGFLIRGMAKDDDNVELWSIHVDALLSEELFQRLLDDGRIVGMV